MKVWVVLESDVYHESDDCPALARGYRPIHAAELTPRGLYYSGGFCEGREVRAGRNRGSSRRACKSCTATNEKGRAS